MDTTINNDMFNSLLDRVERLANPLNTPTAGVYVPANVTAPIPLPDTLPLTIKNKLVAILGTHAFIGDPALVCMHFAQDPANNITLTEFRSICSALGIEG
jgi:hypothetical protein